MGPDSPVTPTETETVKATDTVPVAGGTSSGGDESTTTVRTIWPHGNFHIENVPTVTREGVQLTDAELNTVRSMADANGVKIVEGDN